MQHYSRQKFTLPKNVGERLRGLMKQDAILPTRPRDGRNFLERQDEFPQHRARVQTQ